MKLIVQIPCLNEQHVLPETIRDIPRKIKGVDTVEILVIDDGSTDDTVQVARSLGVDHIISNRQNLGLAATFLVGIEECLRLEADIIVNTDGDNQYYGGDIPKLIAPIVAGQADVVIGDRETANISHFSSSKKFLQRLGSWVVRKLSGVDVPDAVSGFRAISRDAAFKINVLSHFSYTIEMLIQVGKRRIPYTHVPVRTNPKTRESRLFKSVRQFITQSASTAVRTFAMYQPLRVFSWIGLALMVVGVVPILRFLYFYVIGQGDGNIQSLIIGGAFLIMGSFTLLLGLVSDLINYNRRLLETTLAKVRRLEVELHLANKDDPGTDPRSEQTVTQVRPPKKVASG